MNWADAVLNDPNSKTGPTSEAQGRWGHQPLDSAKWANSVGGMGLYNLCRALVAHHLDHMSNVDGAAAFLGLEPRRDISGDFRCVPMGRN